MTFLKKTTFSVGVDFQGSGSLELHGSSSRDYLYARVQEWKAEAERSILCLSFCFLFQLLSSIAQFKKYVQNVVKFRHFWQDFLFLDI